MVSAQELVFCWFYDTCANSVAIPAGLSATARMAALNAYGWVYYHRERTPNYIGNLDMDNYTEHKDVCDECYALILSTGYTAVNVDPYDA